MPSKFPYTIATTAAIVALGPTMALASPRTDVLPRAGVTVRAHSAATIGVYQRAEFDVTLRGGSAPYRNPFDPDEIAVDAVASGPRGRTLRVPAFWYAPYQRQIGADGSVTLVSAGEPGWRVRLAPTAAGVWHLTVTARDRSGVRTSAPITFQVAPSASAGFIRRAAGDAGRRYFQFSNGAPYFLIGENVCWSSRKRGLADYDDWFGALHQSGANYARLWMEPKALESKTSGVGRYDLQNAAYFDEVLARADQDHLGCMLALGTYGEFNTGGFFNEGKWPVNPYNAANGGPVPAGNPAAFFTDATARKLYQRRLRYLIARYSAFTSLGFWEFWNEKDAPTPWFAEMAAYLKANDPYRHPITNSYSTTGRADVWNLADIDLTQTHRYGDEGTDSVPADAGAHDRYAKPHLVGEFGISWRRPDTPFDPQGIGTDLHNGLWSSALSGDAGGASIWWWDSYVHPKHLYSAFTGLARFAAHIDWLHREFQPRDLPPLTRTAHSPETFSDLVLTPAGAWGSKSHGTVVIGKDGHLGGDGTLLSFLYGTEKPDLHSAMDIPVELSRPTELVLRILTVSHRADLHVLLDGRPLAAFPFETEPGRGQDFESTKQFPEYGNIYQARFNKDRHVTIPAGRHTLHLENTTGDWLQLGSLTLKGALSSRYAPLRTTTLQDHRSGETLLWLQDPDSNWANDRDGKMPRENRGVHMTIPVDRNGSFEAQWWDTRSGTVIARQRVPARANLLSVAVPLFRRDIALHLIPL